MFLIKEIFSKKSRKRKLKKGQQLNLKILSWNINENRNIGRKF